MKRILFVAKDDGGNNLPLVLLMPDPDYLCPHCGEKAKLCHPQWNIIEGTWVHMSCPVLVADIQRFKERAHAEGRRLRPSHSR